VRGERCERKHEEKTTLTLAILTPDDRDNKTRTTVDVWPLSEWFRRYIWRHTRMMSSWTFSC